jgi:outer membrane protein OmpA-like peptidoglycan-associated protein
MHIRSSQTRSRVGRACALLALVGPLAGCLTPQAKPPTSQVIRETRARGQAHAGQDCPQAAMDSVSPATVGFAFNETKPPDTMGAALTPAIRWLTCHGETTVVIKPDADAHGTDAEQDAVARGRAEAVETYLAAHGVAPVRVRIISRGVGEPAGGHFLILAEGRRW